MDADEIVAALLPFQQLDSGLARKYQGTGLGLPIAERLARLHGGRLEIASRKGEGTEVTVTLPRERLAG
jgi:two-component system, cell cycle sensor histidine kinase PleC